MKATDLPKENWKRLGRSGREGSLNNPGSTTIAIIVDKGEKTFSLIVKGNQA